MGNFRPPAFPLITHDPYFSIWSSSEIPTDIETVHWTQKPNPIRIVVRIDGEAYRLMGKSPGFVSATKSTGTRVLPTQTIYTYVQDGVEIELSFLSPLLVEDLDLVSRPLSYITWKLNSIDGKNHEVNIYFEISGLATVDHKWQSVTWETKSLNGLKLLKMGSTEQPVLAKSGDDLRIDWGYLYVVAPEKDLESSFIGRNESSLIAFAEGKKIPAPDDSDKEKRVWNTNPVMAFELFTNLSPRQPVEKYIMLAYDDIYSI